MLDLPEGNRLVMKATLDPIGGSTFQPTGFPDLGPAEFERPGQKGVSLLVESVQSMTNNVEALGWDGPGMKPVAEFDGVPYIEVRSKDGTFMTSSRLEPHRLAGAYLCDAEIDGEKGIDWLVKRLGLDKDRPLDWSKIYAAIFQLDPLCLLHGVFFSRKGVHGNPKVRRASTFVIEAHNVKQVVSGGLKRDDVQFTVGEGQAAEEGYGFVPFGRTEYTAEEIVLTASVDLSQIRGYGLGDAETRLLTTLALWEVRGLLDEPLRLRTACDLEASAVSIERPEDFELPSGEDLAEALGGHGVEFEHPQPRQAVWAPGKKKK